MLTLLVWTLINSFSIVIHVQFTFKSQLALWEYCRVQTITVGSEWTPGARQCNIFNVPRWGLIETQFVVMAKYCNYGCFRHNVGLNCVLHPNHNGRHLWNSCNRKHLDLFRLNYGHLTVWTLNPSISLQDFGLCVQETNMWLGCAAEGLGWFRIPLSTKW